MKILIYLIIPITLFFINFEVSAQKAPPASTYYSIVDGGGIPGSFGDGNYWSYSSGGVPAMSTPGTSDILIFEEDMELDQSYAYFNYLSINTNVSLTTTINNLEVKGGGSFIVNGTLEVWDLTFDNGSVINIGSTGSIIVHNDFTNKNNSDDVQIDGSITVSGEFYNGNGGVIVGSGSITAGSFSGTGATFGITPNSSITPGSTVPNTLPVELIAFSAESNESGSVALSWTTATEINNAYFTIEKTKDGINYEKVGRIEGAGNSNYEIKYDYIDNDPYDGVSYYKIKQTDFDGHYSYSELVQVKLNNTSLSINVYPNPVISGQESQLVFNGFSSDKEVLIAVYNILGELQYSKVVYTDSSGSVLEKVNPQSMLPPGNYLVVCNAQDRIFKKKFIVN